MMLKISEMAQSVARLCRDPDFIAAKRALASGNAGAALAPLAALKSREGDHLLILSLEAETELARYNYPKAEELFDLCLAEYPNFPIALIGKANAALGSDAPARALTFLERIIETDPLNFDARLLIGLALRYLDRPHEAVEFLVSALHERSSAFAAHLELGRAYRQLGETDKAVASFRNATRLKATPGEAWLALSDLRNYTVTDEEVAEMERLLRQENVPVRDRYYLHFALGRAYYDRKDYELSFKHYYHGNMTLRRGADDVIAERNEKQIKWVDSTIAFLKSAPAGGYEPKDGPIPIFIVGLPRSGTTLLEQILNAHPEIEGLGELAHLASLTHRQEPASTGPAVGPDVELASEWTESQRIELGKAYIELAGNSRQTDKPYFVDKLPMNFTSVAFIKAILPQAKIIDLRRHPLSSVFSIFRQCLNATLPDYAGSPEHLAELRRHYVGIMERFDAAFPGLVHRVYYEKLVRNTEAEVRALLKHIGVEFDPQCLRWYEVGEITTLTPSSEQVRQPIFKSGLEEWKRFNAHMKEAKKILATELRSYPA